MDVNVPIANQAHLPVTKSRQRESMALSDHLASESKASPFGAEARMNRGYPSSGIVSMGTRNSPWQMQKHIAMHQRLRQVERNLRGSLNISTVLGTTVVESATLLGAQQVSLLAYQPNAQCWEPVAQYCSDQSLAWWPKVSPKSSEYPNLMKQVILEGGASLCAKQSLPTAETRQWLACWPGSWLLVPILKEPLSEELREPSVEASLVQHWGILALALPSEQSWSSAAIACAQSIAIELSFAMQQAQQYQSLLLANQELQKLALSDGLTRLANRRRFDEHLSDEWQRLARDRQPLSLILCDLDHFKRYNDTFGHPAGDRCLIRVAKALLSGPQRPADLVARYGGEEFAVILPNTDTNGAWRIAQKIHESIRQLKIAHAADNEKPYVTVTMGVATIIPGHEATAQGLVQAADMALYHAKQQGRDRTYVHAHYNTLNPDDSSSSTVVAETAQPVKLTPPEEATECI